MVEDERETFGGQASAGTKSRVEWSNVKKSARSAFLILFLLALAACVMQNYAPTPPSASEASAMFVACPDVEPTLTPKPNFLKRIHPVGSITKTEYDKSLAGSYFRGIMIEVLANGIDDSVLKSTDNKYRSKAISDRVSLFVDELAIPNNPSTLMDELLDVGPFLFSWPVELDNGHHEAKLVFYTDSGETLEYLWTFCIVP